MDVLNFCANDQWATLSATDGDVLVFFCSLKYEQVASLRRITASSVSQYLSAVRKMHNIYVGTVPSVFPMVVIVLRDYKQ